jgi:hypothetical protein
MKNILLFTLIILILSACSNNEKKAKKLIKDYLKTTMNDYSSYEPMEFLTLDSTFSEFSDSKRCQKIDSLLAFCRENIKDYSDQINYYQDAGDRFPSKNVIIQLKGYRDAEEKHYSELFDTYKKEKTLFKPEHIGWKMAHQFRGSNAFGAKIINMFIFYLNIDLTAIIKVEDLVEKNRLLDEKIKTELEEFEKLNKLLENN